ncbi:MAG TPA: metalloregulator ArsR/SmtB family transcription factor [Gaiellales bacterium]|nr:metalloregulator ArsR/SmtB family transcription factor [Gaiellales bacterium]
MQVLPDALLGDAARMFGMLADESRLRLLRALHEAGELGVGDLASRAGLSLANTSQHLNRMAAAGLVARRRDGKNVLYRIGDPRVEELCRLVCHGLRERAQERWDRQVNGAAAADGVAGASHGR